MARKFGTVNVEIWGDPDFRQLPPAAQHLYLLLWTAPDLSFCGVHDWRPARLTHLSAGFTVEHTKTVADCLIARHFLVVDEGTEEVLIRSWARFDETLKQPRLAVSYAKAYAATYSATLRSVLVHETEKMRKLWPDLACWRDDRVTAILDHPSVSAKDLPTPEDPFGPDFGGRFGDGFALGLAQTSPSVWGSVWVPPTPAPAPNTNHHTPAPQHQGQHQERGSTDVEREFDDWWQHYPRKVGKGQAKKAYRTARKSVDASVLLDAIRRQAAPLMSKGAEFCPHPATWLNGERWTDEPPSSQTAGDEWMRRRLP